MTSVREHSCTFNVISSSISKNRFLPAVHCQVRHDAAWLDRSSLNAELDTKTTGRVLRTV